ncbi:hypothetical protein KW791_03355 [Candidatus Parcubacteria bacterium]|nr:hypothetical protein [Candidatus Parcubacteria bacterium]
MPNFDPENVTGNCWIRATHKAGAICFVCKQDKEVKSGQGWSLCEKCYKGGYRIRRRQDGSIEYPHPNGIFSGPPLQE